MNTIAKLIPTVVQVSILLQVFALGLNASLADVTYLLRRPGLLFRSLLAMNVVVPFVAILLARVFDLHPAVKVALVFLAVSPIPPLLPGKQLKLGGQGNYVYGLLVAAAVLSIVVVPLMVEIEGVIFKRELQVAPGAVAKIVGLSILAPLAAGLLVHQLAPAVAERIRPLITRVAGTALVLGILPILFVVGPKMVSLIGNGTLLAITTVVVSGLAAGYLLGGPDPDTRVSLSLASSLRHPGVAMSIAKANFPGEPLVLVAVLLFVVVNAIVSIPYKSWVKQHVSHFPGPAPAQRS